MAKLREEIAVQKARETELNKTIHITGLVAFFTFTLHEYEQPLQFIIIAYSFMQFHCRGNDESETNVSNHVTRDKVSFIWDH